MAAIPHLQKQLRDLQAHPLGGFRVEAEDDIFKWTVWFSGPQDTPYHPGQYRAQLVFQREFPMVPPAFRIVSSFWHPNVHTDGRVCISILHPPGVDEMNKEETAMMRWTPVQTIRSVLLSVISLLSDPDPKDAGAPANVDALVQYRKDRAEFEKRCQQLAKKSLDELPPDFVAPPAHDEVPYAPPPAPIDAHLVASLAYDGDYDEDEYDAVMDFGADGEGAVAALPADKASAEPVSAVLRSRYAAELMMMRDMGVGTQHSDDYLLLCLDRCKGDVASALDHVGN